MSGLLLGLLGCVGWVEEGVRRWWGVGWERRWGWSWSCGGRGNGRQGWRCVCWDVEVRCCIGDRFWGCLRDCCAWRNGLYTMDCLLDWRVVDHVMLFFGRVPHCAPLFLFRRIIVIVQMLLGELGDRGLLRARG